MNEPQSVAGCAREPKLNRLTRVITDLNEIREHIRDLHSQVGSLSSPNKEGAEVQKEQPLENLVNVIDNLPDIANRKVRDIHRLLDEIKESLI